ncbi:hypothetical protein ACS0TY_030182 [Phlomoides rotata]
MSVEEKASLVFIPFPIVSHFAAAVTTAKLLSERDERLDVTVLIMKLPTDTKISPYIKNSPESRVNFIHLQEMATSESPRNDIPLFMENQKEIVTNAVAELIKSQKLKKISAFVVDMLCFPMIDVANAFGAPTYVIFICGAASLGLMVDLQTLKDDHDQDLTAYEGSDSAISVSTYVHPVPAKVWPSSAFVKERVFPDPFIRRFGEIKGIIVNTFLEVEHYAITSLSAHDKVPPVYPVGPILGGETKEEEERHDILRWLDEQPDSSIVFLCFGSLGFIEGAQVKEIAKALEQSKQRFLWSLRRPPPKEKLDYPGEFENPDEVLPEGFLDRVKGVGRVIGWAPQAAVLSHPAVGGFVSHCGWNSVLESVWYGVPIATFPLLYADLQANAFLLVKELEMAEMIRLDYCRNGSPEIVGAEEIAAAIGRLMAVPVEEGSGVRQKVKEMQSKARSAVLEGGSSYNALRSFIEDVVYKH